MANCDFEAVTRRPPQTLQQLCRERIVLSALKAVRRIQSGLRLPWLGWPFTCIPNLDPKAIRKHGIRQLQSYLTSVPHLYNQLVLEMYRREPGCTEAILHSLLRILEVNSKSLPLVIESGYKLTKLNTLYLFFNINRHVALIPQFMAFVGSLSHLTHLKLSNCCTDRLLGVIGTNCKHLEVLDAEEDAEMLTTDHGLAFLTNCKNLVTVILNDAGDEYDYEDRYFGITGKGVANLLISLPRLSLLMCEPYLLREGIKYVHSINVNSLTYGLTYLHTRFPDRDFLMSATSLCPNICELIVEDQGRDSAEALIRMNALQALTLENYSWQLKDEKYYQQCFGNLIKLVLKNPKQINIGVDFLEKLGMWCGQLKSLAMTLYHRDLFTRVYKFDHNFFPCLESLTIDGDVSLCLIETLITSAGKGQLTSLTIYIHQLGIPSGTFDVLMLRMARDGYLSSLINLQCFQWEVCLETMLFIVDQCPKLRHIWGLDLLMLSPQSISAVQQHIVRNNRHIDVHDGMATTERSSKGIPFLSERSKHRVEAAEQTSEDDIMEHLVNDGTFDDILREVSLL